LDLKNELGVTTAVGEASLVHFLQILPNELTLFRIRRLTISCLAAKLLPPLALLSLDELIYQ
jgi:hypothetical protein